MAAMMLKSQDFSYSTLMLERLLSTNLAGTNTKRDVSSPGCPLTAAGAQADVQGANKEAGGVSGRWQPAQEAETRWQAQGQAG